MSTDKTQFEAKSLEEIVGEFKSMPQSDLDRLAAEFNQDLEQNKDLTPLIEMKLNEIARGSKNTTPHLEQAKWVTGILNTAAHYGTYQVLAHLREDMDV